MSVMSYTLSSTSPREGLTPSSVANDLSTTCIIVRRLREQGCVGDLYCSLTERIILLDSVKSRGLLNSNAQNVNILI